MYNDTGGRKFLPNVDTYHLYYYNFGFSSFMDSVILIRFWRTQGQAYYFELTKIQLVGCALCCSSAEPIVLDQWHSVKVSRLNQEGVLQLDGGPPIRGTSGPPLNELNLELPLYIGGVM